MKPFSLHWFRRDLRLAGNTALDYAREKYDGRVLGIFCFDSAFLGRPDFSANRFGFFLRTLNSLREEMRSAGGDLLVIDALPTTALPKITQWLRTHGKHELAELTFNRDYEPFARQRDEQVLALLGKLNLTVHHARDHLIIEPSELAKDDGTFYQVFTPFARKWFSLKATGEIRDRCDKKRVGLAELKKAAAGKLAPDLFRLRWRDVTGKDFPYADQLAAFEEKNSRSVTIELPPAGSEAVEKRLQLFRKHIDDYGHARDIPAVDGTSKFSLFFKNGSLSPAQAVAALDLTDCTFGEKNSRTKFFQEIVWREFYYHILYHCPHVESGAFRAKYDGVRWQKNSAWLQRWQEGTTGFPIVDAGMRQLNSTGWMHNRVRMIVASFLTKDLLIHWQEGERYFMHHLLDGDLAPNNGGWQWAASTGCDPQPYFRVFNPWLQGEKFDPQAEYIQTYVPELRGISPKQIHQPDGNRGSRYPRPIVDHSQQKAKAIALFKQ